MGMDLSPQRGDESHSVSFNWSGWSYFLLLLREWGVLTNEFVHYNDGAPISEATCIAVADAMDKHMPTLHERDRKWLEPKVNAFRHCGGMEQW